MNKLAEVFPPGEFLIDELNARAWTQAEFAEIIGRPYRVVNEIVQGKKAITPETAVQLAESLGTSPEFWMNLESQYQLSKVTEPDHAIKRRSDLRSRFPVHEMIKRGWIESTDSIVVLEQQCMEFFEIKQVDEMPTLRHAAKKTSYEEYFTSLQLTWLFKAKQVASAQLVPKFSKSALVKALPQLQAFMSAPEEARHVPRLLNECGVRFVVVESLPGIKLDGACFWLSASQPVVALSLRLDRIDNFWFVLRHEIEHVLQGDGKDQPLIDEELGGVSLSDLTDIEKKANLAASEFCLSRDELSGFIARVSPYHFANKKVVEFAARIGVHPGIVVGQLQHRFNEYKYLKKHQVKVRQIVVDSSPSDGWGVVYGN